MISSDEVLFICLCVEWFLYGKILISALTLVTLAKEIQLFSGTGLYSGIFAIYLQCPKKDSRTAMIVFYVLCLLFVLSTASVVCDLLNIILYLYINNNEVSNNPICNLKNMFFIGSTGLRGDNYNSHCGCPSHTKRLLWCHRTIYHGTINIVSIRFIHLNLQRSTDVGSCGVKMSMSWSSLHSWHSHT